MAGKKERVTIDERKLQEIIAGDYSEKNTSDSPIIPPSSQNNEINNSPLKEENSDAITCEMYIEKYLQKQIIDNRRQTSLSLDGSLVIRVTKLLSIVGTGVSISGFINNLLAMHIESNKDILNELFNKHNNQLF